MYVAYVLIIEMQQVWNNAINFYERALRINLYYLPFKGLWATLPIKNIFHKIFNPYFEIDCKVILIVNFHWL